MRLGQNVRNYTDGYFRNLSRTLDNHLKTLTVRLTGQNRGGFAFNASGVMYKIEPNANTVWILTAAHNLRVWYGEGNNYNDDDDDKPFTTLRAVVPAFKGDVNRDRCVKVQAAVPMLGGGFDLRDYDIQAVRLHDSGNHKYGYDVCELEVHDNNLCRLVKTIFEYWDDQQRWNLSNNGLSLLIAKDAQGLVDGGQENYQVVQYGFGRDGNTTPLNRRAFSWGKILAYHDDVWATSNGAEKNSDVLLFESNNKPTADLSTTSEGDSGGPAFVIGGTQGISPRPLVKLLGVSLGWNQKHNGWIESDDVVNNSITIVSQDRLDELRLV